MNAARFLVAMKPFNKAKSRLAPALPAPARAALARAMFRDVLSVCAASGAGQTVVVAGDGNIAAEARAFGARPVADEGRGDLSAALASAVAILSDEMTGPICILHADLPCLTGEALARLAAKAVNGRLAIATDSQGYGTNAIALPGGGAPFSGFAFGPGSLGAHMSLARVRGFEPELVFDDAIALDVDLAEDLARAAAAPSCGAHTRAFTSAHVISHPETNRHDKIGGGVGRQL